MGIFGWFSSKGHDQINNHVHKKISINKAITFAKEVEKLGKFYMFLKHYVEFLLHTEEETIIKVKEKQKNTKQTLKDELLIKELWILYYITLHVWFFEIKTPNNSGEAKENIALINHAFQNILDSHGKTNYLPWLKEGFAEFVSEEELDFTNFQNFQNTFPERLAEKIPQIAFDSTEGRLGGELFDFVVELIMTNVQTARKAFEMQDGISLTNEEIKKIKQTINSMNERKKNRF